MMQRIFFRAANAEVSSGKPRDKGIRKYSKYVHFLSLIKMLMHISNIDLTIYNCFDWLGRTAYVSPIYE